MHSRQAGQIIMLGRCAREEGGNMPIRTREGFLVLPLDGNKPGASLNISRDGGQTWTFSPGPGKPLGRAVAGLGAVLKVDGATGGVGAGCTDGAASPAAGAGVGGAPWGGWQRGQA